jgi:hypothetical protein
MHFEWEEVRPDSIALRAFNEGPEGRKYDLSLVLQPVSEDTVEVTLAHGDLSADINIIVGLKAHELGYTYLVFHAAKDSKVTRWAELLSSDTEFNYYRVNLPDAVTRYFTEKAL